MTKPTETPEFAESADPADVTEPVAGRTANGYLYQDPLPHDEHNWLLRQLFRWATWFNTFDQTHIHDGGSTDISAPKVRVQLLDLDGDSVGDDVGAYLEPTASTTGGDFTLSLNPGSASDARFAIDYLDADFAVSAADVLASTKVRTDVLQPSSAGVNPEIQTQAGAPATLNAGAYEVEDTDEGSSNPSKTLSQGNLCKAVYVGELTYNSGTSQYNLTDLRTYGVDQAAYASSVLYVYSSLGFTANPCFSITIENDASFPQAFDEPVMAQVDEFYPLGSGPTGWPTPEGSVAFNLSGFISATNVWDELEDWAAAIGTPPTLRVHVTVH